MSAPYSTICLGMFSDLEEARRRYDEFKAKLAELPPLLPDNAVLANPYWPEKPFGWSVFWHVGMYGEKPVYMAMGFGPWTPLE